MILAFIFTLSTGFVVGVGFTETVRDCSEHYQVKQGESK